MRLISFRQVQDANPGKVMDRLCRATLAAGEMRDDKKFVT